MHEQADDDAEGYGPHRPGNAQLRPENAGRENNGQDIDGRPGVEKGGGRAQARSHFVDAGKERQNGAGTDRQDSTRC